MLAEADICLEVIVVDDGSDDRSAEIAHGFGGPVRCYSQTNAGLGAARNAGVARARGRFLGFLDADDLWTTPRLGAQLDALAAGDDRVVFGQVRHFVSPDLEPETRAGIHCPSGLHPAPFAGSMLIESRLFERIGRFREDVRAGEFLDWLARANDAGLMSIRLDLEVLARRLHGTNNSIVHAGETRRDLARAIKDSLDRRRASAGS